MPHALQQASAASFFPTAKELSSGVQWFKDHPVLAAAAATAVSVITYLNALELPEGDAPASDALDAERLHARKPLARPSLSRRSSGHNSDGKLSAAVSWCDEHGGSLTQVFEDESSLAARPRRKEDSDSDGDDVAEGFLEPFSQRRQLSGGLRKSGTTQQLLEVAGNATPPEDADAAQTESPQWGWYVPITPPQDQFVQATGRESSVVVPCHPEELPDAKKSMRRSVSGRIP